MARRPFDPADLKPSTVAILHDDRVIGTGWLFTEKYFITSAQVLESAKQKFVVQFHSGKRFRAEVREWMPGGSDLAILEVPGEAAGRYRPLRVSRLGKPGGTVHLFGFEPGSEVRLQEAVVLGEAPGAGRTKKWSVQFTPPSARNVLPGAPVLTGAKEVFGILSMPEKGGSGRRAQPRAHIITLNDVIRDSAALRHHFYAGTPHAVEQVTGRPARRNVFISHHKPEENIVLVAEPHAGPAGVAERTAGHPLRFPDAAFYRVRPDGTDEAVAPDSCLAPPPAGWRVDFRFGFDTQVKGMPHRGEPPGLAPPEKIPFPIRLRVDVWSDDVEFDRETAEVTVPESGPSDVASFPLRQVPPVSAERRVAVFVFVRHETHLVGAFRVEAAVAAAPSPAQVPQVLDYIYLDSSWFRFERRALAAPALTVYLRTEGERVQVFAFAKDRPAWGAVGVEVPEFQEKTREVYLHVTRLAVRLQNGETLPFATEAAGLCELGYQLFSDLFFSRPGPRQEEMRAFADYVRQLPAGSEVTIANEPRGRPLLLPWGIVYDGRLPGAASGGQEKDGFWGHRFKLTVRPSLAWAAPPVAAPARPRMATIYENRKEAVEMTEFVGKLAASGKIQGPEDLPIQDYYVPRLATDPFELVHCFCHGYTDLHDRALSEALTSVAAQGKSLMASGDTTRGSYLYTQRGTATLARLQEKVPQLPGRPVVLLSMCESAQVSSSGRSFVTFFLEVGARAVVGTEGPNPWDLAYRMDTAIVGRLLDGSGTALRDAVWEARRNEISENVLALIYTVYGDGLATLAAPASDVRGARKE